MVGVEHNKIEGGKRTRRGTKEQPQLSPLISIITAVYNGSSTIEETIKSILSQNHTNFEYIVVDGGSTDGTIDILKKYDDDIDYWISEPDKGIYDAFNKGIDLARGEWLYFIGADDTLFDDSVFQKFFSTPIDSEFLYGNVIWGEGTEIVAGEFFPERFYTQNICQQAIFYNKKLFHKIGKFNLKYRLVADWVFNMKAFGQKNVNPSYIDTVVAIYSLGGTSTNVWDKEFLKNKDKLFIRSFGFLAYIKFKTSTSYKKALLHSPKLRAVVNFFTSKK